MNHIDWLKKLIAFDTTSRNSNLKLIQAIEEWLLMHNIKTTLTYDNTHQKANLFATLLPQNGSVDGGIILSGHTDVVPTDGQEWDTDPFQATVIKNRLYGRGASDMKGFIAVILAMIPELKQIPLKKPLHFAFSYDEEIGCLGIPKMIADIQQQGIHPAACIVGEPSEMKPIIAHKGINAFRCRVHGHAAHSSLTSRGCNAIEYAAQLIMKIKQLARELKNDKQDSLFDVAYTTMTTNIISGGTAVNIIPDYCEFFFEFRQLPGTDINAILQPIIFYAKDELVPQMQKENADANIAIESMNSVPAHEISEDAAITQLVRLITNEPTIRKVSYATEAGLFQQAEIPTLICGPGSIEQAHRPNEYIELEQLNKCEDFIRKLITGFSGMAYSERGFVDY